MKLLSDAEKGHAARCSDKVIDITEPSGASCAWAALVDSVLLSCVLPAEDPEGEDRVLLISLAWLC